jgi:hypothetical protein
MLLDVVIGFFGLALFPQFGVIGLIADTLITDGLPSLFIGLRFIKNILIWK